MKLVILDRDGVINIESSEYIKKPEEWRPIPGSLEAIVKLSVAGYKVAVATNQSGIARGLYQETMLHKVHDKMLAEVKELGGVIDKVFYCPHHPDENCFCRKPQPGLLHQIAEHFACDLTDVPFIGDSERDILAARQVNCRPILVLTGYGRGVLRDKNLVQGVPVFADLARAVDFVLGNFDE